MSIDYGQYTKSMGILVDIVPVYFHENNEETSTDWSENTRHCIQVYGIIDFCTFRLLINYDKETGLMKGEMIS